MGPVRHITLPGGFVAAGVHCGLKTTSQEDLTILAAERDAAAAVLTTTNQVVGWPVLWNRKALPRGFGRARAIVVNSGCSNVCTGPAGWKDAQAMAALTARSLGCPAERVLVASTGIIGHRLPMAKVRAGIAAAADALGTAHDDAALRGIMTTDTREKSAVVRHRLAGRDVTVAGVAKGAGMIAPSMATMIALVTTDATIAPRALHKALKAAAAGSFNAVTIDSDTSTSDTLAALASGAAGNRPIGPAGRDYAAFAALLHEVCSELARAIVLDGEGATRLVRVAVRGARDARDARLAARSVADSPLFKCAIHGADPNWGRIAAALGKSPAKVAPDRLTIRIGGVTVFARGTGRKFDLPKVEAHMAGKEVSVACDLGLGDGSFTAITCDLSHEYVTINADYHT